MKLNAILKAAEKYNNSNIELNKIEPQPQEEQSRERGVHQSLKVDVRSD